MEHQVNKPDSTFKTILLCDVCRKNVAHVVCFNSGKENEVRVCKDCMERAMGVFEDDEPEKKCMDSVKEYGKLSNGLTKVMIIVALLGIGIGVITAALLMR